MLLQSKTTFLFKFPQGVTLPPHPEKDFEDWQKYLFVCLFGFFPDKVSVKCLTPI